MSLLRLVGGKNNCHDTAVGMCKGGDEKMRKNPVERKVHAVSYCLHFTVEKRTSEM
jgi:hypothetical protein